MPSKRTKCINLTKETQVLYSENHLALRRKMKENQNKWKDIAYSWVGRVDIVKMAVFPKLICLFNQISSRLTKINLKNIQATPAAQFQKNK